MFLLLEVEVNDDEEEEFWCWERERRRPCWRKRESGVDHRVRTYARRGRKDVGSPWARPSLSTRERRLGLEVVEVVEVEPVVRAESLRHTRTVCSTRLGMLEDIARQKSSPRKKRGFC